MKERKKKEKRYFADWVEDSNAPALAIVLIVVPLIILAIISYTIGMAKYANWSNSYSTATYDHLKAIATLTVKEGYIDTSLLPDDVTEYDISYDKYTDKNTVYTYSLDVTNKLEFIPTPKMTITLSEKYEILSEESVYSSEESYMNCVKFLILSSSFSYGFGFWFVTMTIIVLSGSIAYPISKANKKRDTENNTSDCT